LEASQYIGFPLNKVLQSYPGSGKRFLLKIDEHNITKKKKKKILTQGMFRAFGKVPINIPQNRRDVVEALLSRIRRKKARKSQTILGTTAIFPS
jgi:hypothetical protein